MYEDNSLSLIEAINPSIDFNLFETDFPPSSIINTISDPDPNELALNNFSTYSVGKRHVNLFKSLRFFRLLFFI